MSRVIVKNLPDKIKESRIRELFSCQGGEITDIKLCFTKQGVFRKFAFVGYKNEQDATNALNFLDKTYIDTSKINVELCKDLGDQSVSRPWSKYAEGSSAFLRKSKEIEDRKERIKKLQEGKTDKKKKKKKHSHKDIVLKDLDDVKDDPNFQEFLAAHLNKAKKQTWTNENAAIHSAVRGNLKSGKEEKEKVVLDEESSSDEEHSIEHVEECTLANEKQEEEEENEEVEQETISRKTPSEVGSKSDLDWLKSKATKTKGEPSSTNEVTKLEEQELSRDQNASKDPDANTSDENSSDNESKSPLRHQKKATTENEMTVPSLTIKMRGIPFKCTEEHVVKFFKSLNIEDIRFQKNKNGKPSGYAFVDFATITDAEKAMKKDEKKMNGRYIELFMVHNKKADGVHGASNEKWKQKDTKSNEDGDEGVAESGRLFVRNLSYTCTEEDLETLFSKYGALVEVNLPVDKNSNKTTGYAFITFMMPEHAVKALSELDGKIFQGRILHLLPGKGKKTKNETENEGGVSAYKRKKETQQKVLSASSHNWNALFLGQNAVADVMANRLNVNKRGILDSESSGSVAVRMALGETELVSETREFLESQGVKLDVFGQAKSARSKTVMLVKNLPPSTTSTELNEIFSKYGDLGRILMPPFGITAIVEFVQAKEAKEAFSNLAYSKFKHTPLYLEWAPVDILTGEVTIKKEESEEKEKTDDEEADEEDSSPGSVIFVKNLNFNTTEEKLKECFACCGKLRCVTVAKKKDPKRAGNMLSMGYGFVEYKKVKSADKAIKTLQHCNLDSHKLELKKSHRESITPKVTRKKASEKKQTTSKIVVRNIPFEANEKELRDLFSSFGHLKSVRLPKKMTGTGTHRGFAFIDFTTKQEAKRAFKALCQSTHLYGRRLVLEWAEDDDSVDILRRKTAQHFHEDAEPQTKKRKIDLLSTLEKHSTNLDNEET